MEHNEVSQLSLYTLCIKLIPLAVDILCVILGCESPILLRPNTDNTFKVVGTCFFASLSGFVGILGPLPDTWTAEYRPCEVTHRYRPYDVNRATEEKTFSDARLGPLEG